MKKELTLLVLVSAVFALMLAGFVLAANDNDSGNAKANEITADIAKNMTYGQCVVAGVLIKQTCYNETKIARASCITTATNDTVAIKQCKADYKKVKAQCKADFKAVKKECIRTTKPGMWQRLRYSMA